MACNYVVEIPLESGAVHHVDYDAAFGSNYEPSDEATDWLDLHTGHYWFYEAWISQSATGARYYSGLRFFLPTEQVQLLFKLAWGGK